MSVIFQPAGTRQRGRTMLELLISMAIGSVVLGALMVIYLSTNASNRQSTAVSRMNEDAGIVMNLVGTQLRMAGFSLPRRQVAPGGAKVGNVLISVPDRNFIGAGIRGCDHGFVNLAAAFDSIACSAAATGSSCNCSGGTVASPGSVVSKLSGFLITMRRSSSAAGKFSRLRKPK